MLEPKRQILPTRIPRLLRLPVDRGLRLRFPGCPHLSPKEHAEPGQPRKVYTKHMTKKREQLDREIEELRISAEQVAAEAEELAGEVPF